ncbi:SOS response-associated peptidase, partial [Halochromatium roseum]|uniref:SOS response-associated peptidase n=1 Tax=Halochromatium roseum TaxID=391920 RepID=UPI001913DB28
FAQVADPDTLANHFGLATTAVDAQPRYNVAPTQAVLAVRLTEDQPHRECVNLRWGLVPFWSKGPDNRYSMINARAETVASKPAYRAAFAQRRCLIPADAFYEWQAGKDGKQPYAIRRKDRAPFAMAGLFEHWQGDDGSVIDSPVLLGIAGPGRAGIGGANRALRARLSSADRPAPDPRAGTPRSDTRGRSGYLGADSLRAAALGWGGGGRRTGAAPQCFPRPRADTAGIRGTTSGAAR